MKHLIIVITNILICSVLYSQIYQIEFSASGESSNIDNIVVENLSQCHSISLNGNDVLVLAGTVNLNQNFIDRKIQIYPNPSISSVFIDFYNPKAQCISVELFNSMGALVLKMSRDLESGYYSFEMKNLNSGVHILTIDFGDYRLSERIVSFEGGTSRPEILFTKDIVNPTEEVISSKSVKNTVNMQYNQGDILLFTAYSGSFIRVETLVPTQNQSLNFHFIPCTDGDGINYSVVTIGTQTWMAENLRTTKYSNGISIPYKTSEQEWLNSADAYCWIDNDISNAEIFGALYNWNSILTEVICPTGWRVPTDYDWGILIDYVGGSSMAGGKLKSSCSDLWYSPNEGATNEFGFAGLPAGYRKHGGDFSLANMYGDWWAFTQECSDNAWVRSTNYFSAEANRFYFNKKCGFPVRCIKQ